MMTHHRFDIPSGTMHLTVHRSDFPVEDLLQMAQRENPRRAFLFVSTVLGRHIPVSPARHRQILAELVRGVEAELLEEGPVLVMGYAETAVGLGAGVHDELLRQTERQDMMFLPTTRHPEIGKVWFSFSEDHSHASTHHVLAPATAAMALRARAARTLVLVDDETTTGKTFVNLLGAAMASGFDPERIILVTLTDWSGGGVAETVAETLGIDADRLRTVTLLEGAWDFRPTEGANVRVLPGIDRKISPGPIVKGDWRCGIEGTTSVALPSSLAGKRVLVIGTGENVWAPFRLAEEIEACGHVTGFLATTRSPVTPGPTIRHKVTFCDHYGIGIPMYLHNVAPEDWDEILLCVETEDESAVDPDLARFLGTFSLVTPTGEVLHFQKGTRA